MLLAALWVGRLLERAALRLGRKRAVAHAMEQVIYQDLLYQDTPLGKRPATRTAMGLGMLAATLALRPTAAVQAKMFDTITFRPVSRSSSANACAAACD